MLRLLSTLPLLLAVSCASDPPVILDHEVPDALAGPASLDLEAFDYRIGPGDVLRVNVFHHPELSSQPYKTGMPGTPVDGSGFISLPLVDPLDVNGLTVFETRDAITALLTEYLKKPRVDVSVVEFGASRVYVLGEVREPGMFVLDRPVTVIQLLALAGGFNADANRRQIALLRGGISEENLFLIDAEDLDPLAASWLRPNDVIFVGRTEWASLGAAARNLVPVLQLISLPVGTARDVALFQDLLRRD